MEAAFAGSLKAISGNTRVNIYNGYLVKNSFRNDNGNFLQRGSGQNWNYFLC